MIASYRMCLLLQGLAALDELAIKIFGKGGERHGVQMRLEYRLDFAESAVERTVHRLFNKAAGNFAAMAHGHQGRRSDRPMDVRQCDDRGIAVDHPAAAMALGRGDEALISKPGHHPADDDGVPPREMIANAREQVAAYPSVRFIDTEATEAEADESGFAVTRSGGDRLLARKLVLAFGLKDGLPDIPGLWERCGGRRCFTAPTATAMSS
jgi:hypothetical protein